MNNQRHRWFVGKNRPGDRTLKTQVMGLSSAQEMMSGATVLDLGCAEGILIEQYFKWCAALVHGVEIIEEAANDARELLADFIVDGRCHIATGAIERLDIVEGLLDRYDVVCALGVMHKTRNVIDPLRNAAKRAGKFFILRNPPENGRVIGGHRQHGDRFDCVEIIRDTHTLIEETRGWNDEWIGYFSANNSKQESE